MHDRETRETLCLNKAVARSLCNGAFSLVVASLIWAHSAWGGLAVNQRQPMAPAFSLQDLDGRTRTLNEFLGAKPVVLEFMSIGCPHCREMAPVLTRLHEAHGGRFVFLTVVFEPRANRAKAFAQVYGHTWCYLLGTEATARAYSLEGVPTFLLLGPDGRIRGVQVGSCPYEEFVRAIEAAFGPL
jgi:thiol-disulfide isomerase/thioredoxin